MRGVTWRAAPAKFKRGMCEMKILGSEVLWCIFGTLVQDGLAQMRGVTGRAVPAKFKTRMCEMKIWGSEVLWCIFGTLVQDGLAHMRSVTWRAFLAKFKNTDVRDEIFVLRFCGVSLGHWFRMGWRKMRGMRWRVVPAKFKTRMCEMEILWNLTVWSSVVYLRDVEFVMFPSVLWTMNNDSEPRSSVRGKRDSCFGIFGLKFKNVSLRLGILKTWSNV